ncbi:MAG: hypothetical protein H7A25_19900 [Leptospiraceae bacterium]|nr:hypothetical protein [Leptospiraceae bacterium]MCP5502172.1 hypothetical protein [Leptospiraceae bacterium]
MSNVQVSIPDSMDFVMDNFIKAGIFPSKEEMLLAALSKFVQKNQIELLDYFANQDIDWALKEKESI